MRRRSPGRAFAFVDARTHVFVRSVMPHPCAATTIAAMVVSISLFDGRVPRNLEWTDQARGPASPRSPSRNGFAGFFPLPRSGGIPREAKKPSTAVLRCAAGLTAAGRSLPGPRTAIEAAMGAARQQRKTTMATIGTFTAADNGYGARDHEYKRHGTVSLLAGIDLVTGKVYALVKE